MFSTEELQELSPEQQELFFLFSQEEGIDAKSLPIIPLPKDKRSHLLSSAQQKIWFLNQLEPTNPAYNMFGVLHLKGKVDHVVLTQSFKEIIRRHDALRASFPIENNHPVMIIRDDCFFQLEWVDLSHLQIDESHETVQKLVHEEQIKSFDLSKGELIRASLLKLTDNSYLLLFTTHHIISDAWSLNLLLQELSHFYQSISSGTKETLPAFSIQYADYTAWQQNMSQSVEFKKSVAYWMRQLQGVEGVLNLPMDATRLPLQTSRGKKKQFIISDELTARIRVLSITTDSSLFMLLLAVFHVLLFRYSNQTNFMIGSVISNRSRRELESLIGLFANTLVLKADLSGDLTFQNLLSKTKQMVLEAFQYQDVPFELIVEKLQVKRDLSHHPLFQVMFVYENGSESFNIANLEGKKLDIESGYAKFDLTLFIKDSGTSLMSTIEYNADLFLPETIESYIESYLALLENIVRVPNQKISKLQIINERQATKFLAWQDNSGPAKNFCLHQHFERWVELTPHEIAVSFLGDTISYQQLNWRSNKIAHRLIASGVKKNQPVAMMLDVGIDQIATLLAICKVGGVFVCLDQQYPKHRLKQILEEVKPSSIILDASSVSSHLQSFLSSQKEADYHAVIMNLSEDDERHVQENSSRNPDLDVLPSDPVYIVYTSGSTGKPKGILQTHGCSSQYMEWQSNQFEVHPKKRMAQWASITYDASYSEIFGALCFGATLCMAAPLDRRDPKAIADWLVLEKITVIQLVPSFCNLLLQCVMSAYPIKQDARLDSLEFVLLAGERLPVELAREFQEYFRQKTKLYNLYGPSEIVLTTQYAIDNLPPNFSNVPIGTPFVGRQILILDSHNSLCPLRIPGEIYIKSPYLTQGYFQQEEETSKVFIQNPLHDDYPDRVYKTGDRGRWLNDQEIEFLGRNDNQVKIRGSRVEVGEIEAVLLLHKEIKESAVIIKRDKDETIFLVAFISGERPINSHLVKDFLVDYLPSYMIPTHIVFLENFPRTISGKIDRKMLATQYETAPDLAESTAAPESTIEKKIADVWKELLNLSAISVNGNFFDLGGHSLLMVQVQLKLAKQLNKDIALVDLFKYPTIKSLANFLLQQPENAILPLSQHRAALRRQLSKRRHNQSKYTRND